MRRPPKRAGNRGEGKFQEVDWYTALNEAAAKLREIADKYGPQAIAFTRHDRLSWHLPLIAALIGTPNVVGQEETCHGASTAAIATWAKPPTAVDKPATPTGSPLDPVYPDGAFIFNQTRGLDERGL